MKRVRGLLSLVQSAVEHGSRAVEKVQIEVAKTPFDLIEMVPPLKAPASGVRLVYNTSVSSTHGMIRLVNKVAGDTIGAILRTIEEEQEEAKSAEGGAKDAEGAAKSGGGAENGAATGAEGAAEKPAA